MLPKNDTKPSATYKNFLFDSVFSQTQFSNHYILQLVFSTIITTLGLLTNNTVVVIGAMLISPLFWPVMGIALGIITTRRNILKNSTFLFFASLAIVITFSFLVSLFVPITELPGEVVSRINPTILDLFIALFTSIIGVIALYYPTISASATGVALSISLLPPLCVFGIGLSHQMGGVMLRSLLLFGTNVGAIIFVGVVVLYILRIRPRKREEEQRFKYGVLFSGILMVLLSIPLTLYLKESLEQNSVSEKIKTVMSEEIVTVHTDARLESVDIDFLSVAQDIPLVVNAKVYLPENIYMTQSQREDLLDKLVIATDKSIDLELDILSTLSLQTDEDKAKTIIRKNIRDVVLEEFAAFEADIDVDTVNVTFPQERTDSEKTEANILILVKKFTEAPFTYKDLQNLKSFLEEKFEVTANIDVEFISVSRISQTNLDYLLHETLVLGFEQKFSELSEDIFLKKLDSDGNIITAEIDIPSGVIISAEDFDDLETLVVDTLGEEYSLEMKLLRFETL